MSEEANTAEALPKTPLDYSLKLNDEIEAALKAPIQEPEPLFKKLEAALTARQERLSIYKPTAARTTPRPRI